MQEIQKKWFLNAGVVPIIFYRALVQGAGLHPINRMIKALLKRGLNPMPIFVASLKDPLSIATIESLFNTTPPDVILNCTSFAVGSPDQNVEKSGAYNPLIIKAAQRAPVFQVVLSSSTEAVWEAGLNGLNARDIAMNVALPEGMQIGTERRLLGQNFTRTTWVSVSHYQQLTGVKKVV